MYSKCATGCCIIYWRVSVQMTKSAELMTVDNICNRVYIIRGQQVMLDYDLAEIYGYELKAMNQQVKRNIERFPEDFMFQLKKEEVPEEFSKSQIVTLNEKGDKRGTNIKKMPFAFTEQVYHCGASSKDAGKKLGAINVILETSMIHPVIDKLLLAPDKQI